MSVDDQLRGGTLSEEQLAALAASVATAVAPLEQRIGALEENATGDGAAFPAQYQVTNEGDVKSTYNEEVNEQVVNEVIEEILAEEGSLLQGGKGGKAKKLPPGSVGNVLTIGPGGKPEWLPAGGSPFKKIVTGKVLIPPETGEIEEVVGEGFTAEKLGTGFYKVKFTEPFDNNPIVFVKPFGSGETGRWTVDIDSSPLTNLFDVLILKSVQTLPDGPTLKEIKKAGFSFEFLAYEMA